MDRTNADNSPEAWQRLLREPYHVSAWAYFNRSYNLLPRASDDRGVLFYCAFELRCAIERILYEYLSHIRNDKLTRQEIGFWSAKTLKQGILDIDPDFIAKIDFMNIILEARGSKHRFAIPDLDALSKDYARLNVYLHAQKRQQLQPSWWATLKDLVERLHAYAWPFCSQTKIHVELNEAAIRLFEDYKSGRSNREEALQALKTSPEDWKANVRHRNFYD
jgi:hypothetical protein